MKKRDINDNNLIIDREEDDDEEEEDWVEKEKMEKQKSLDLLKSLDEDVDSMSTIETAATKFTPFYNEYEKYMPKGGVTKNRNIKYTHGSIGHSYPISVPSKKMLSFYKCFASGIQNGEVICIDEKLSRKFCLFFDLDLMFKQKISWSTILKICGRITFTVGTKFFTKLWNEDVDQVKKNASECNYDPYLLEWNGFGDEGRGRLRSIVVTSLGIESERGFKMGVHLHFGGQLLVDSQEAMTIRNYVVEDLITTFGERDLDHGENPWSDVVDSGVLDKDPGAGGVRMIGSSKIDQCPTCRGTGFANQINLNQETAFKYNDPENWKRMKKESERCPQCNGKKKVHLKKNYYPKWILKPHLNSEFWAEIDTDTQKWLFDERNFLQLVLATSIRSDSADSSPEMKYPEGIVPYNRKLLSASRKRKQGLITNSSNLSSPSPLKKMKNYAHGEPDVGGLYNIDTPEVNELLHIIHSQSLHWNQLRIVSMTKNRKYSYKIEVGGIGAGYCLNATYNGSKGKDHAAEGKMETRIFFELHKNKGLIQYCYSRKEEYGCKKSIPVYYKVPTDLKLFFFGNDNSISQEFISQNLCPWGINNNSQDEVLSKMAANISSASTSPSPARKNNNNNQNFNNFSQNNKKTVGGSVMRLIGNYYQKNEDMKNKIIQNYQKKKEMQNSKIINFNNQNSNSISQNDPIIDPDNYDFINGIQDSSNINNNYSNDANAITNNNSNSASFPSPSPIKSSLNFRDKKNFQNVLTSPAFAKNRKKNSKKK